MTDVKLLLAGVVGLVAILAAYVVLVVLGHGADAAQLGPLVLTLLGFIGLGGHVSSRLNSQDAALTTITQQTNGVLSERIRSGAEAAIRAVLADTGTLPSLPVPDTPAPATFGLAVSTETPSQ